MSKFASEGLVQTLADELDSTSSRINAINPGKMKTRLRAQAYPAEDANLLVEPSDVVKPFIFLLGAAGAVAAASSLRTGIAQAEAKASFTRLTPLYGPPPGIAKLNANENPYGPSKAALAAMQEEIQLSFHRECRGESHIRQQVSK